MAEQVVPLPLPVQILLPELTHSPVPTVQGLPTSKPSSMDPSQSLSAPSHTSESVTHFQLEGEPEVEQC